MTLRLVSEARPILWEKLSLSERRKIEEADKWLSAVRGNVGVEKSKIEEIYHNRSGRVLFIDGKRGAGKTSLMLTLLEHWRGSPGYWETSTAISAEFKRKEVRLLLPILDFDPLPRNMPLHGWLLEPWRKEAMRLQKESPSGHQDLTELSADLFERAVIGWAPATTEGKGIVERTIAYQEQASGWIDTSKLWHEFVDAVACRAAGCSKANCNEAHSSLFVVAIDDVDLQVEQLPGLLHAIRLFDHPQVVYVLTGSYEHLKFALGLDYLRRHGFASGKHQGDELLSREIERHSDTLRDAFLQKALPEHARLAIDSMTVKEAFAHVGPAAEAQSVESAAWSVIADGQLGAGDLPIATARHVQHAKDRQRDGAPGPAGQRGRLEYIADICGTTIAEKQIGGLWQCTLGGELTTRHGLVLRSWAGKGLRVVLTDQPTFAFIPANDENRVSLDEEAHQALVVQLAVETEMLGAPRLSWRPDAGVVTTEVSWEPESSTIESVAVFNWPWLVRPTVSQVFELKKLADEIIASAGAAISLADIDDGNLLSLWVSKNVGWARKQWKVTEEPTANDVPTNLAFLEELSTREKDDWNTELARWVGELFMMTAPYFGLQDAKGSEFRGQLQRLDSALGKADLIREQYRRVKDAIIARHTGLWLRGRTAFEQEAWPSPKDFDTAAETFLKDQRKNFPKSTWWEFLGARTPLQANAVVDAAPPVGVDATGETPRGAPARAGDDIPTGGPAAMTPPTKK